MERIDATILSNEVISDGYRLMRFHWPAQAGREPRRPAPGLFFTLRAGSGHDPTLRRPFAFSGWTRGPDGGGAASFVFQVRGRGTAWLAGLRPGDALDALGPLGSGFSSPPDGARPILLAGGIGVGPMLYLAEFLASEAEAGRGEAPILALGVRSARFVPDIELPTATVICTDDGSAGFKGTAIDWLSSFDSGGPAVLYACGPKPMMAAAASYAGARGTRCEAALEQWMACGVGACLGCAVPTKGGGFIKACSDGPVVDAAIVDWEAYR